MISEEVIKLAVVRFEEAMRLMVENRHCVHAFDVGKSPDGEMWSCLIIMAPQRQVDMMFPPPLRINMQPPPPKDFRCFNCKDGLHADCLGVPCQCQCPPASSAVKG